MPEIKVNGANLHYENAGSGPETIVFGHGLLWSGAMFAKQVEALKDRYRCVTFDWRGQGGSEVTADGYDMETLYADEVALIEGLGLGACHLVGLSMGGFIAMRIAARRPELVRSLTLIETSADPEPTANIPKYRMLNVIARWIGLGLVAKPVMKIMFGQTFLNDPTRAELRAEWRGRLIANHRVGITRATGGVIERKPIYAELDKIKSPTLVIVGDEDVATVPDKARRIHERIPHSQLVVIPRAGHTSSVEEPAAVNAAIEGFLGGLAK